MSDTTYACFKRKELMLTIEFYETAEGKCPVDEFMSYLEPKMLAKTLRTIDLLATNGHRLREPYSAPLKDGLFELRTKMGSDITRIIFFFCVGDKAILTNGFLKKTRKTPREEIKLAEKYKKDYERRCHDEQL